MRYGRSEQNSFKAGELNKNIINAIVRERKSTFLSTDFIL